MRVKNDREVESVNTFYRGDCAMVKFGKIVQIGDELGVILPEEMAADLSVNEDGTVDYRLNGDTVILKTKSGAAADIWQTDPGSDS